MTQNLEVHPDKQDIHLLDYWHIIWRGRWTVLSIFVIVVTMVAVATFTQTPIYRAIATVEISPQSQKVAPVADVAQIGNSSYGWFAEERYFNTQYEIIKSRAVADRVFARLDLYNHPRFTGRNDPIGSFARLIQVNPVKDTGIVEIIIESSNPEEASQWVNAVAQEYVQRNLDEGAKMTSQAVDLLLQEIAPLREELRERQKAGFSLAAAERLYTPDNQKKITSQRLLTLQTDLTETQVKREGYASLLRQIDEVDRAGGSYESIPEISNDDVMEHLYRNLAEIETEYQKLLVSYRGRHIRVQEKLSEIEQARQKIALEADRIISNLRTEYALLREKELKLAQTIEKTKIESMAADQKASSYELVQGDAAELKRIYDLINSRVKEITLSTNLLTNNLRVLDASPMPRVPVKPRVVLNLFMGILLGLVCGVGAVFFRDYMDKTIRGTEDIEQFLKLSLLAVVPKETGESSRAVKEAYQTLRTSLMFARRTRDSNTILITSAGPQEGKSCTAVNIGRTIAGSGEKTMVLDCDLRRPTIHKHLKIDRDGGITNFILSTDGDDWRRYVRTTAQPNLYAMSSGPIPPNPADIFGHERFQKMLKEIRREFDWIIIDSPPVMSLADTTILASQSDSVAFVIKHNENDKEMIRRCVSNIRKVNPNIAGAILNNVDLGRSHYRDYYYLGYYYYGESDKKKRRKEHRSSIAAVGDDESKITRSAG